MEDDKEEQSIAKMHKALKSIDGRLERIERQTRLDTKIVFYFSIFFVAFFIGQFFISVVT